jgi:high-affinity nickel permease
VLHQVFTGLSTGVAFLIDTNEISNLLSTELHVHGGFWNFLASFNINRDGFLIDNVT